MNKDRSSGQPEYVDLPWGRGRIVEVVSVASAHHDVSLELLEFEDGTIGLRFVAYQDGKPLDGPLVLDEDNIVHVARTAGQSRRIHSILQRLAAGIDAE